MSTALIAALSGSDGDQRLPSVTQWFTVNMTTTTFSIIIPHVNKIITNYGAEGDFFS